MSSSEYHHSYYLAHKERAKERARIHYEKNKVSFCSRSRNREKEHPLLLVHSCMLKGCGLRKGFSPEMMKRYAGKGITVCDQWRKFSEFEKWALAHGWKRGLQIDRIDNNGNYEPSNCRFVTSRENNRNRECLRYVVFKGKRMCITEAMEVAGTKILRHAVYVRLNKGWSVEDALLTPARKEKGSR